MISVAAYKQQKLSDAGCGHTEHSSLDFPLKTRSVSYHLGQAAFRRLTWDR